MYFLVHLMVSFKTLKYGMFWVCLSSCLFLLDKKCIKNKQFKCTTRKTNVYYPCSGFWIDYLSDTRYIITFQSILIYSQLNVFVLEGQITHSVRLATGWTVMMEVMWLFRWLGRSDLNCQYLEEGQWEA